MLTVLVTNTKGGCGKTTVATHLAAAFAGAGLKTALADADRQRSSFLLGRRRRNAHLQRVRTPVQQQPAFLRLGNGIPLVADDGTGGIRFFFR